MALIFTGPAEAVVFGPQVDLSRHRNGDMVLTTAVRLDAPIAGSVQLGFGKDTVDIAPSLRNAKVGEWRTIRVRLACFDAGRTDTAAVETPFAVKSDVPLRLSMADIGLVPNDIEASCPTR